MNELGEKKRRLDIIEESSNIKHKKNKKHKKKDKTVALTSQYGSKGIIQKSDFYTKVAEFTAWAREVKNIAIDSLAGRDQKILFEEFREDFNTATLPGKKFYNLEKWELKQRAVHDEYATFNFKNDERNAQIIAKKQRAVVEVPELGMSRQQLLDLKAVQEERIAAEKLRRIGVTPREDLGVRYDLKLSKARKDDHDDGMQSYLAR